MNNSKKEVGSTKKERYDKGKFSKRLRSWLLAFYPDHTPKRADISSVYFYFLGNIDAVEKFTEVDIQQRQIETIFRESAEFYVENFKD